MLKIIKKRIGIDFLLLFILVINYLFTIERWHHIGYIPLQGPPENFYFFFFAVILIIIYFLISFSSKIEEKRKHYLKTVLVIVTIFVFIFSAIAYQIALRKISESSDFTHDGVIGTEEAIKFLDKGQNPYAVDYRNTAFGVFNDSYSDGLRDNPAWIHYVYLPFLPIFSLPFYKISEAFFSFYDQRMVYGLLFFLSLFLIYKLPEKKNKKIIGLLIFAFNPLFFPYFIQGYNDIFVFFWILASLYFLKIRKLSWSLVFLALACASKQSAWLIIPFYLAYLYLKEETVKTYGRKIMAVFKKIIPLIAISLVIFTPFLVWGFNDFIDDVYRYPAGSIESNFPMVGYGISHLIYKMGLVNTIWDYFPFWILQVIFCLPLLYFLIKKQKEDNALSTLVFSYGIFLFVFWFFSRFFNSNYVSYLSLLFLVSYLIEEKECNQIK